MSLDAIVESTATLTIFCVQSAHSESLTRAPRPHARRLLAPPRAHRVAVPSRAAQNHWVRPAFGFNIQEVIDLFDSRGWVVNPFDGLEEDDK